MSQFETISIDVEKAVKEYLKIQFPTIDIRNKILGADCENKAVLIRREGNFGEFDQSPVDGAKIAILCRDKTPDDSFDLASLVRNKLNGVQNIKMGDKHCYSSFIESGPIWVDDNDTQLSGVKMVFNMIFREE